MTKVLIVDDQPWALLGIKNCYPWKKYGLDMILGTMDPYKAFETRYNTQFIIQKFLFTQYLYSRTIEKKIRKL